MDSSRRFHTNTNSEKVCSQCLQMTQNVAILIFSEELAYYATKKSEDTKEAVPLTMKPFYAIFILCGIFYLLSTICFLFEIIHEFIKKKLTRQNQTPIVDPIGLEVMEE